MTDALLPLSPEDEVRRLRLQASLDAIPKPMMGTKPDALPVLSETDFQTMVMEMAHQLGWKTFAVRRFAAVSAKTGKLVGVVTSEGWPDLVLVRGNKIIFWELKADKGKLSPEQHEWLAALEGVEVVQQVGCVRPSDWKLIEGTLKGG